MENGVGFDLDQVTPLSVALADLEVVGRGRTADVYAWGEGEVVKLFYEGYPEEPIRREALATRTAHDAGLKAAGVRGLVQIEGRIGVIYERITGTSIQALMLTNLLQAPGLARQMGRLHAEMHNARGAGLIRLTDYVAYNIAHAPGLSEERRAQLLANLAAMPDGEALCHGDLHPDNILLTAKGPVVIDWMNGVCGNPIADVARTRLLFSGTPAQELSWVKRTVIALVRQSLYRSYLRSYRRVRPAPSDEIAAWLPIMAAARLTEGIPEEDKVWLRQVANSEC